MMMDSTIQSALNLIKEAIWGNGALPDSAEVEGVYALLRKHAIHAIPAGILNDIDMSDDLKGKWKKQIFQQIYNYMSIVNEQDEILSALTKEKIPVVTVKGTSAAQYYPTPQYRAMGDIDLLVKKEDFHRAERTILACGYRTTEDDHDVDRHITLKKSRISVELHWRFASENVIDNPSEFDEILYQDIECGRTILSTPQNGLVLLEHIAQHLNAGIGLRQIIDWMMYVNKCLDDQAWKEHFQTLAKKTGLEKLAVHITKMCQIYLGLTENHITWCKQADEEACESLMNYIINCGNFGHGRKSWESGEITKIPAPWQPVRLLRYLQKRGEKGWALLREYPILKPVAWIYQLNKYIRLIRESRTRGVTVRQTYDKGSMRRNLFKQIGINIKQNY